MQGSGGPAGPGPASCNDETMSCAGIIQGSGTGATGGGGAHSHPVAATFAGGSDSVLQPYATIKYIIKT